MPAVDACATDDRGLVTCLRDMVDRRFNLPGEVPQQPSRSPTAQTAPVTAPISVHPAPTASAPIAAAEPAPPAPVAEVEPLPEPPKPTAGQGGPYIPPAPERVADLRPDPVEPPSPMPPSWTPSPPASAPAATPAETIPPAPTADVFVDIAEPPAPPESEPPTLAAAPLPATPYTLPPAPVFPPLGQSTEPVAPPAPKPADMTVAAGPEIPPVQQQPRISAPIALAPTIDAIELEGTRSFVSGSGPAGAVMRLFADDEMIGESPVEEGRWLVETGPLLTSPRRELKIEAVDPDSGKSLGQTVITVEIEPESDSAPSEPKASPPAAAPAEPEPETPAPELPQPSDPPAEPSDPPAEPAGPEPSQPAPDPQPGTTAPDDGPIVLDDSLPEREPTVEPEPTGVPEPADAPGPAAEPLPKLLPKSPERETASVTILGAPGDSPSMTVLPPREPAILAQFDPPRPRGEPVTVLKLVPFGDPVNGRFTGGKAIIRRGDTLWTLAHRYYGAGIHYRTIFEANRDQIRRPSRIFPGQIFDLPLVTND